jgi:hypothetical protein
MVRNKEVVDKKAGADGGDGAVCICIALNIFLHVKPQESCSS